MAVQYMSSIKCMLACVPLLVVSCGGGGGGEESTSPAPIANPTAPVNATSTVPKGRWVGAGVSLGYVAIAVPANVGAGGTPVDTLWVVSPDAATLHKLHVQSSTQVAGTVGGNLFAAEAPAPTPVSAASYTLQSAGGQQLVVQGLPNGLTLGLSHSSDMAAPLTLAQAQGNWQASFDGAQVNWRVQEQTISGTGTTGCSYSGQLVPLSAMGVYRVQFTETCAQGEQRMNGIATVTAASDRLSVLATTDNDTSAAALLFAKLP